MPIRIEKAGLEVPDQPMWTYDPFPDYYTSITAFIDEMVTSLLLRGNAYVYSLNEYSTGYPRQMFVLDPDRIHIDRIGGMSHYFLGMEGPEIDRDRLLHIRYLSWAEDPYGYGPLDSLTRQLQMNVNLDEYAAQLAGSGAVPWGVLSTEQDLNREQADLLKNRWLEASSDRQGAPAILSGGLKLQPLSLRPADMAMLELSQMSDRRIATAFGIQPFLLGIPIEGSSGMMQYANVTSVADLLWRLTLRPLAHTLSAALSKWALPYGTEAIFDSDSFLRPDMKTLAETAKILVDMGVIDEAEARGLVGLPPRESPARIDARQGVRP
jgi:HK97 family phage portal protein